MGRAAGLGFERGLYFFVLFALLCLTVRRV